MCLIHSNHQSIYSYVTSAFLKSCPFFSNQNTVVIILAKSETIRHLVTLGLALLLEDGVALFPGRSFELDDAERRNVDAELAVVEVDGLAPVPERGPDVGEEVRVADVVGR